MKLQEDAGREIEEIYRSSVRGIYAYCLRRLLLKHFAEDAAAQVFLRLVERYPEIQSKNATEMKTWLFGTASNVIAAFLKDSARQKEIAAELAREKRDRIFEKPIDDTKSDWPVLYEAIGRLKPRHQEILILRFFHGLRTSAIAEALTIRHATVRVELSRAVKRLRRALETKFGPCIT